MQEFQPATPVFRSFDEAKTKEFYLAYLGFEILFEHRFEPHMPLYMAVKLGNCEIHLSEHQGDVSPHSSCRINISDVRTYCKALNDKKYGDARPSVVDQPWRFTDMQITDPSGNKLIFGTPQPT